MAETETGRTAGEAGWHESRYNVSAPLPDGKNVAIVNLFRGTCAAYNRIELYRRDRNRHYRRTGTLPVRA